MKIASWNVNGIRAVQRKGALDWIWESDLDIVCLQETKARPDQLDETLTAPPGWSVHWSSAEKAGYSGVVTYVRDGAPLDGARAGFGPRRFDAEGRSVVTDHGRFLLYNVYFPNGKASEERLRYKMDFYAAIRRHLTARLKEGRDVVVCGDVNTAHREIDLARPKENEDVSGFLPQERAWITRFLAGGWVDTFRAVHGDLADAYTWWSFRSGARLKNIGWRIDYFFVNEALRDRVADAWIRPDVMGSDHCPLGIELRL